MLFLALVLTAFAADEAFVKFNDFVFKYEKRYDSLEEFEYRFKVFQSTLARIDEQNAAHRAIGGENVFGVNGFADMTSEEFSTRLMPNLMQTNPRAPSVLVGAPEAPTNNVDWRNQGVITAVKDQGQCGSCWAHSADEAIESFDALNRKISPLTLSVEQCTACTYNYNGCNGGWPHDAYIYGVKDRNGIDLDSDYPYNIATAGVCKFGATGNADKPVTNDQNYKNGVNGQLGNLLNSTGPVSVCVAASAWQTYTGGILKNCPGSVDHCVQAVGYQNAAGTPEPYWIVRNSWGKSWGIQGYIWLDMATNNGDICHIQEYMTFPTF
jgi:Pyruvate/2-oxoacid:ferredoxin oxidoreductase delta subunit